VGGVDALVAEDAADLEDAVDAADDEPLEVQLEAMRSVMSRSSAFRWVANGRAAAPPWTVCRTGRLDLDEAVLVQHVAHRPHHRRPVGTIRRLSGFTTRST
jgi:hypothetical protein